MKRPSLVASAAPTATYDWNGYGQSPGGMAASQFLSRVAGLTTESDQAAYLRGGLRTDVSALDAVPVGWRVIGDWRFGYSAQVVAEHDSGALAMIAADSDDGTLRAEVFSPRGHEHAHGLLDEILALCPPVEMTDDERTEVRFWTNTAFGPRSYVRQLTTPAWGDITSNYASKVRGDVSGMHAWSSPPTGGRLLLAHGPAGTGKTTALGSLAHSWRGWCDAHYVIDPDEFFGEASYMISVLLGEDLESRWRLIIVEDCDELLTANAKERSGQAVARLLNICDGMVGQGLRILLALTTNESVENFHEAIVRPGRCLRNLHFGRLSADDADAWRTEREMGKTGQEASLAELYAEQRSSTKRKAARVADRVRSAAAVPAVAGG